MSGNNKENLKNNQEKNQNRNNEKKFVGLKPNLRDRRIYGV